MDGERCGKRGKREKVKIGGNGMKNERSAERTGNEEKEKKNGRARRDKKEKETFTFSQTLCSVRDVV